MKAMGLVVLCACFAPLVVLAANGADASASRLLLRDPSLSEAQVAFAYAGDIWVVDREGGVPRQLTRTGRNGKPRFSPDGSELTFTEYRSGESRGTVYVIHSSGGQARRLTYHPADIGAVGWTPDGKEVLFVSARSPFAPYADQNRRLFKVPAVGGYASALPFHRAADGSYSGDGRRLAYVPNVAWAHAQDAWKQYRGGQTLPIWIAKLADSSIEATIPRADANDFNPMWIGDTIYFLSDRSGPVSLFAYELASGQVMQVAGNDGLDLKSADATADAIVYEQFGSLHLYDLRSGETEALDIRPLADLPEVRPHFKKVEPQQLRSGKLSPSGRHALFVTRGEILTASTREDVVRNLTGTQDAVELDPAWSPDGQSIAYLSDQSGEYELHVRDWDGSKPSRRYALGAPPSFYHAPRWSPDSHKISYSDKRLNYWYLDLATGESTRIDTDRYVDFIHTPQMAWSPDSRWIVYTKQLANHLHALFAYSLEHARSYQLTDGMSDVLSVALDESGRYLYFTASMNAGLLNSFPDMTSFEQPVRRQVYLMLLQENAPSPLLGHSDTEPGASVSRIQTPAVNAVDIEGIGRRVVALPVPAGNYYDIQAGEPGIIYLIEGPTSDVNPQIRSPETTIHRFDLQARASTKILEGVNDFTVSFDGKRLLYSKQGRWFVSAAGNPKGPESVKQDSSALSLDSAQVYVDPRAEWRHMFEQTLRNQRDFFYDPELHGASLAELRKVYQPYLDSLSSREDLTYLLKEMLGNLVVGHMAVGGPPDTSKRRETGLLGVDYAVDNGRYRMERIYEGDIWDSELNGPLARPGARVRAGEYLLAVDGREVLPPRDVYSYFESLAGRRVVLTVGGRADGRDSREIEVEPIADETALRHFAWVEENRRRVDELSGGRVAYVYLQDTTVGGYTNFNRYYFGQVGRQAVIIDARYNHGGKFADYIIEFLRRPVMNYFHMREGHDVTTPMMGIFGPKVMLINEMSGSGGDLLPWMFRRLKLGPLIGKRTWGGLVGHYTKPGELLDGGSVSAPNLAFYTPEGTWEVENHGVAPDIETEDDPQAQRAGHDPQLEKAVGVVLGLLEENPPPSIPQRPPFPDYQRK